MSSWYSRKQASHKSNRTRRTFEQLEDRRVLANIAPDLAEIANVTAVAGNEVVINLVGTDEDGTTDQLHFFFDPDETPVTNAVIDNETNTFRWTPAANQVGTFRFVILVTDQGDPALADAEEFTITVNEPEENEPPFNTVPGAQTVEEDEEVVFSTAGGNAISIADPDAGDEEVQVTLTAANGLLTFASTTGLTFTTGDGTDDSTVTFTGTVSSINAALEGLRFIPTANFSGEATLTITTNDLGNVGEDGEKTDTDTITINVTPVADSPSVTDAQTDEDTQTTTGLVITRNASDSEEVTHVKITNITGGTLYLNDGVTEVAEGSFITFEQAAAGLRFTPDPEFSGEATFSVQASTSADDTGLGGEVVVATIEVAAVNDSPLLEAIEDQTVAIGEEIVINAVGSDVDSENLTYMIDPDMAALGATIDPVTGVFRWTPSASQPVGPVTVRIIVIDDAVPALADSETFVINVVAGETENQAPTLTPISNPTVEEGTELTFIAQATDPDASDTVTYSLAEGAPEGATIDPATGEFTWTPTAAQAPGEYTITVVATDNGTPALSASQTFTVTVNEASGEPQNSSPVLDPIGDQAGEIGFALTFTAFAEDSDGDTITYSLDERAPEGASIDPVTGVFTWTPTTAGTFTFSVIATDDGTPSFFAEEELTLTISESAL